MSVHERKSDRTKEQILGAAGELFSTKGFDSVTIRQIAKKAGCSHTTIYLYFKDKETLLHQLSKPPLEKLYNEIVKISAKDSSPSERLNRLSQSYILFGLTYKNMYRVFINTEASRVDEEEPELEINKLRQSIFAELEKVIAQCLSISKGEESLLFTRVFFYTLHGIVTTYLDSNESVDELYNRLKLTFEAAVESLLLGFQAKLDLGVE